MVSAVAHNISLATLSEYLDVAVAFRKKILWMPSPSNGKKEKHSLQRVDIQSTFCYETKSLPFMPHAVGVTADPRWAIAALRALRWRCAFAGGGGGVAISGVAAAASGYRFYAAPYPLKKAFVVSFAWCLLLCVRCLIVLRDGAAWRLPG